MNVNQLKLDVAKTGTLILLGTAFTATGVVARVTTAVTIKVACAIFNLALGAVLYAALYAYFKAANDPEVKTATDYFKKAEEKLQSEGEIAFMYIRKSLQFLTETVDHGIKKLSEKIHRISS